MLYKLIHKNTLLPFVLLPFLLVVFWGKLLFLTELPFAVHDTPMPLCEVVEPYVGGKAMLSSLISLFITFLMMFGLNRFNSRFVLLKRQSLITGYIYLIFVSGYLTVQQLHPVWFFAPMFLVATDRIFIGASRRDSAVEAFNATFLVTLGALFYAKALFFIPLVWWVMALVNVLNFRSFLATLLGLLCPAILTAGIYFLLGRETVLVNTFVENLLSPVAFYDQSVLSKIYLGLLVAFILVSIVVVVGKINTMKILNRKLYRVFIAMVTYGIVLSATPFFSLEIIPIIGVGASVLLARFFESMKANVWRESLFALLVLFTFLMQLAVE